jgi:hypothetical protein
MEALKPHSRQPIRQVIVAALVLVTLLVGSLAHNHLAAQSRGSSDSCTACLLHHTQTPDPVVALPERVPAPPVVAITPSVLPIPPVRPALDVAPKTSPPLASFAS